MKASTNEANIDLIAIVDQRPVFRRGFKEILCQIRRAAEIIEVSSCDELEKGFANHTPGIIFLAGYSLDDMEIISLSNRLRRYSPSAGIAIYDHLRSFDFLIVFFRDCTWGYLREEFDELDLKMCINSFAQGLNYVASDIAHQLIFQKPLISKPSRHQMLSGLESKVASCLIMGMTTSEIAKTLDRRSSTISTVKSNIYKKIKVRNVIDLITALKKQAPFHRLSGE